MTAQGQRTGERRVFCGLDLPDSVRGDLWDAWAGARAADEGVRWVREESFHVTLHFVGRIREEEVERWAQRLGRAARDTVPFDVRLGAPGCFPGPVRARALWTGAADPDGVMADLARALGSRRAFRGHVTTGRCGRGRTVQPAAWPVVDLAWTVRELCLFESTGGGRYPVVARAPFFAD